MAEPGLADKVVLLHEALDRAAIPHAYGGALALAYYAEPRATVDIDVNLFVGTEQYRRVLDVLEPLGVTRAPAEPTMTRDGQGRAWWGRNPLDLFFAYDAVHLAMRDGARVVPFGPDSIPILAPEHLVVAKVVFDRPKDWLDLEQLLVATPDLDVGEITGWLDHLVGSVDARARRFEELRRRLA
ncbi:MAG TPA: hypothetical protein VM030_10045 [Acidimicrobiales bacterium]|nr:hypothetical protein [Acidimicrobiales bacterium]